jgi:hypothetical protein
VQQVLRAQHDVGTFFVTGHGLNRDLFAACQMAAGRFSWCPNELVEGPERGAAFKLKFFELKFFVQVFNRSCNRLICFSSSRFSLSIWFA